MLQIPTPKSKKGNFWGIRFLTVYLMLFVLYRHIFRVLCDSRSQHSQTKYTNVPFGMLKIICTVVFKSIRNHIFWFTKNLKLMVLYNTTTHVCKYSIYLLRTWLMWHPNFKIKIHAFFIIQIDHVESIRESPYMRSHNK